MKHKYYKWYKGNAQTSRQKITLAQVKKDLSGLPNPTSALQALRDLGEFRLAFTVLYAEKSE